MIIKNLSYLSSCLPSLINFLIKAKTAFPTLFTNPQEDRRHFLEDLCKYLILPQAEVRNLRLSLTNYNGIHTTLLDSIKKIGLTIEKNVEPSSEK